MATSVMAILAVCLLPAAGPAVPAATMDDVRTRLASEFHQGLYARTYESLLKRVEPDGYFQESLTGAYAGMFPRTTGGLVSLFLETGELAKCEALLSFVAKAIELNDMERVPHVIGRLQVAREPVGRPGSILQAGHPIALYRLDQPERFGGAQAFTAPGKPIRAAELWLAGNQCTGPLRLAVAAALDGPAITTVEVDAAGLSPAGSWVRFEFRPALRLDAGRRCYLRPQHHGTGVPAWWGLADAGERPLGAACGRDTQMKPGWLDNPGHVSAFALDTGDLRHTRRQTLPILSSSDEIDGQAHVLVAWARLALRRGPTAFEDRTYPVIARILDRSTDWPYLTAYIPEAPGPPGVGLVHNFCLEHSRDGRFWDAYDILAQSFAAASLVEMTRVAQRRGDHARVGRWQSRLRSLEAAIRGRMVRQLDGKPVYLEMRLPDGNTGVPFEGLGWLNLGPVAAQWAGVDREILRNTVAAYRQRALFDWQGKTALAMDWWPDRPLAKAVIGKGVGWEVAYSLQVGEPERICQWLDFLEAVNTAPIYMEAAFIKPDGTWALNDPGNGEQCAWWCWGMARARRAAGLEAGPARGSTKEHEGTRRGQ